MKGDIYFTYDALGNKWYKSVETPTGKKGTAYLFGYQYEFDYIGEVMYDWKLMFFPTAEGYVSAVYPDGITGGDPPKFAYVTNIRDHLGNLRMSLTRDNGEKVILQERNYYPFGLLHKGYNEEKHEIKYTEAEEDKIFTPQVVAGHYKYWYQEQERQTDLDLNWDSFKYRNYDYAIGRFMSVDPLAEKYPYNGVYNFSENRVIDGRELEGLEWLNSTTVLTSGINGAAGVGVGVNIGKYSGAAYDMVGYTLFTAESKIHPGNQNLYDGAKNPRVIAGWEFGINANVNFYRNKPLFRNTLSSFGFSLGSRKVNTKMLGGVGINFGDENFGFTFGLGVGFTFKSGTQYEITEAFSLTYDELKEVATIGDSFEVKEIKETEEGFIGTLYIKGIGDDEAQSTGIKMFCGYKINEEGQKERDNLWESEAYREAAKKYRDE